ncbi:MAG TPA: metalloregulator ArsR/SmtB family transcription factor [Anaeromyxobacteraceae bacterium]|nr:metalloregulator ArsR/SmtB family transcription factor [Anaeromyxobacteraceae bacterium]
MKLQGAVERLSALAQETRLELFRRLVRRGPDGMPAGVMAEALAVPKPTLSFHLTALERAGLVTARREGRSIVYAADYGAIAELVGFLYENCCGEDSSCLTALRRAGSALLPKSTSRSAR